MPPRVPLLPPDLRNERLGGCSHSRCNNRSQSFPPRHEASVWSPRCQNRSRVCYRPCDSRWGNLPEWIVYLTSSFSLFAVQIKVPKVRNLSQNLYICFAKAKIGGTSAKHSNKFDAFALGLRYLCGQIQHYSINKKKYHKGYKWVKLENYKPELTKEEIEYYKNMPIPPFKRSPAYNDRAIVQLTLDGQYVREWPAIVCVNDYGYNSICVSDCVRHRQRTASEYRWMYKEEYQNTKEVGTELKDYRGRRKVAQLTPDGKLVKIWDCARDVEKYGFCPQAVNGCCRHKDNRTRHKGFIWEYLEEYETGVFVKNKSTKGTKQPVVQLSLDNKFIKQWDCIADTAKEGFNKNCVNACCVGRRKTHKNFKWMYLKDYKK